MSETATASVWNGLYQNGRYADEPPIPFVDTILENLEEDERQRYGLYVGCGNGRNYLPLRAAGLKLHGMDISPEAIKQLREHDPELENCTFVSDFGNSNNGGVFGYIVSIQAFQHGDRAATHNFFSRAYDALIPGGKLFLRVNSAATDLTWDHRLVEGSRKTGRTALYRDGPKTGTKVHYFSKLELIGLTDEYDFSIIKPLVEVTEERQHPLRGQWTQWETIWQKGKS